MPQISLTDITAVLGNPIAVGITTNNPLALGAPTSSTTSLTLSNPGPTVLPFGAYINDVDQYPNDAAQIDLFNVNNQYLESIPRATILSIDNNVATVNPETDLIQAGFISGKYQLTYRFLRNHLGSSDGHKVIIQEISNDRLEIRIQPYLQTGLSSTEFVDYFGDGFFQLSKSEVLPNLYVFTNATEKFGVFDYIQDVFTVTSYPFSIILKLTIPLPSNVLVGDLIWISQEVSTPIQDSVLIIPPSLPKKYKNIAGPNFNVTVKNINNKQTEFKNWNSLISTSSFNIQGIVNQILSGSVIEGINLNVDYRNFKNFIFFSSARERLLNFQYKVGLIESYDARINQLTVDLTGLPSGSSTGSFYFKSNLVEAQNKKNALIGAFDSYEKYLYYESHSYETSSYGEFYPSTWPKATSEKPYVLYSVTSSQAEDWFDGILTSASLYDNNNPNRLEKLVPEHVAENDANSNFTLFVNMIGHYFDLIYAYIKAYTEIYSRNESLFEGFSKDLVYAIGQNLGIDFENGGGIENLWEYALGTDETGSYISSFKVSSDDRVKETWKRIIANLPHLLKTKGTERSIRALINCYGLPATILRIREYGGPEPEFTTKTDLKYERFFYALKVGDPPYPEPANRFGRIGCTLITSPWTSSFESAELGEVIYRFPNAVELRFKIDKEDRREQTILELPDKFKIKAFPSGSDGGEYIGFFLNGSSGWASSSVSCSVFDSEFHWLTLNRLIKDDSPLVEQTYKLILKTTRYEKVTQTFTSSLYVDGNISSSYNSNFTSGGLLYIPGLPVSSSVLDTGTGSLFKGHIQELRYWVNPLEDSVIDNHALAPTSFQGDLDSEFSGTTSSFYNLVYRQTFGSDNIKQNLFSFGPNATNTIFSKHPNQDIMVMNGDVIKSSSFIYFVSESYAYYEPVRENHSLEWPDLGGNRSVSNKIRIDPTLNVITQDDRIWLLPHAKIQKSVTDSQPPDSPRLGIYLSPQNEINQDIAEQLGGVSIDDYIGSPHDLYRDHYPDLEKLGNEYFKKYKKHNLYNNYIRLIKYYDASLFQLIKKLAPYRANLQTGLVLEPNLLERSRFGIRKPSAEDLVYTSSLSVYEYINDISLNGYIQDADGDVRDQSGYVFDTEIKMPQSTISGDPFPQAEGSVTASILQLTAFQNQFNNQQIPEQGSANESLTGHIDTAISATGRDLRVNGSQYEFYTYVPSGSSGQFILVPSVRYDYSEGILPVILINTLSEFQVVSNPKAIAGVTILPYGTYYDVLYEDT